MLSRAFAILAAALIVAGPAVAGTSGGGGGGGHASGGGHTGGGHIGGDAAGRVGGANGRSAGIGPATRGAAHAVAVRAAAKPIKPHPNRNSAYANQFNIRQYYDRFSFDACAPIDLERVEGRTRCGEASKALVDRGTGTPIR